MPLNRSASLNKRATGAFITAGVLGAVHAGVSFYWAAGGQFLAWSVGTDLVTSFQGREWLLAPIGLAKLAGAVGPLLLARAGWPLRRFTRLTCWFGALVLLVWGGLNTLVANLILTGVIRPTSGFDRAGMIGHAYLWDPLFLAWGVALTLGLLASRGRVPHAGRQ